MSVRIAKAGPAQAEQGLVLLHGRGGGAEDILGLGQSLGIAGLALAAPQHPQRSWWPTSFLAPSAALAPHLAAGLDAVEAGISALEENGIPRDRIALAGFSQGACLALEYSARRGGIRAVFGLSGALVGTADAEGAPEEALYGHIEKRFDYGTDLSGLPVIIELHAADPHIPLDRAERSADVFLALGAAPHLHVLPGAGHGLGPNGPTAMRALLNS
ncbi:MAG: dienelactone hydrolase family protein [Pseudomonadota bacterium]